MTAAGPSPAPSQRSYPLPAERHLPGLTPRPQGGPVAAAAAAVRAGFEPADWPASPAFLYGFDLLAAGCFWEAHEVWEPGWLRCPPNGRERHALQGLIQAANAGLKAAMGRPAATRRLLGLAAGCFAEAGGEAPVLGLDPGRAAAALAALQGLEGVAPLESGIAGCAALRPMCNIMQ